MKPSANGICFIKKMEGCRPRIYYDQAGYQTIGIGHLLTQEENRSGFIRIEGKLYSLSDGLTEDLCQRLLLQDLSTPVKTVTDAVQVELNQNQFDALVSFAFNVGSSSFRRSTLLVYINSRRFNQVPTQMLLWCNINGEFSKGLRNRREAEVKLWNTPYTEGSEIDSMLPIDFIEAPEPRRPWYKRIFG